ncbi:MAG: LON peptidase substrate-binding domain-containing protein [Chitinophagaceae bacterium]|nr:LON peptidase substrate-binding domain-containing protein [Rubrivivax sp.]
MLDPLPLFPLQTVLFPGALLGLKVFEARYLDLMSDCMRHGSPFGVVCMKQGSEVERRGRGQQPTLPAQLETVGVAARIDEVDAEQPGILQVRCTGLQRFRLLAPPAQRDNGLWMGRVESVSADPPRAPGPAMLQTVTALAEAIKKLQQHDKTPFAAPYRLDDAGWVANRWCELLPVSLAAKQKLMELDDPVIRLSLVDGFLRDKKVVVG